MFSNACQKYVVETHDFNSARNTFKLTTLRRINIETLIYKDHNIIEK